MSYKIAVVGATGNVGREILEILDQRNFPAREVVALASRNSAGKEVSFGDTKTLTVQALDDYDFTGTDIALFSPGSAVSKIHAPRAAAAGCVVIDNTSHFRMMEDIPLVVPEVNPQAIAGYTKKNIIANPNCSTIQMVVALKPLDLVRAKIGLVYLIGPSPVAVVLFEVLLNGTALFSHANLRLPGALVRDFAFTL